MICVSEESAMFDIQQLDRTGDKDCAYFLIHFFFGTHIALKRNGAIDYLDLKEGPSTSHTVLGFGVWRRK